MPSLRFRIFNLLLQNRHVLRFGKKETSQDWRTGLDQVRANAAKASKMFGKLPKGLVSQPERFGDVPAEWIAPAGFAPDPSSRLILYFHGGGYVLGTIEAHRGITAKFVKKANLPALLFGYRLAPEHPYPAALDNACTVYTGLLKQGMQPQNIVFCGDSAGGGLCLAALLRLKDRGVPLPAACAAISPWTDLACTGESLTANAATCLSPKDSWHACAEHYVQNHDPYSPYVSPLYGDLSGLPPLMITAGGAETLLSDATRFAQKAEQAGVDVELAVGPGLFHCWPACAPLFPEASEGLDRICRFLSKHAYSK